MRVKVKVIPRAKKEKIENIDGILRIHIHEPPIDNKANKKVVEVLAGYFKIKKNQIKIIQGETCREKIFEIEKNEIN